MELLLFILVSVGIIVIPGPNVFVIISTTLSYGKVRGLQAVAGTSAAMLIQLCVTAFATSYFLSVLAEGFIWLKWMGVAYLMYLGLMHLSAVYRSDQSQQAISAVGSFQRGFWVSLTNPKTILFFSAFLPQFTVSEAPYLPQIIVLSAVFWSLAVLLDSLYALLSSKLSMLVRSHGIEIYQNGLSGLIYCGAASVLASACQS